MAFVGTQVVATETPSTAALPWNTGNGFMIGVGDFGTSTAPVPIGSLSQFASTFGTPSATGNPYSSRTSTNATLFDSVDTFFQEGGQNLYVARVLGAGATAATLTLADASGNPAVLVTAASPGVGGNAINVAVSNASGSVTVTLSDPTGSIFSASSGLTSNTQIISFLNSTGLVTAAAGSSSNLPANLVATPLAGGSNGSAITLAECQTALNLFGPQLGPGQLLAPGITNTQIPGIWSALLTSAHANNRRALLDMPDGVTAAAQVSAVAGFNGTPVAHYGAFWAGNVAVPGVLPGTTRSVPPSAPIAALCARVDQTGNPNQAAAGPNWPLRYVLGPASLVSGTNSEYSLQDLYTLNAAGINTWAAPTGQFENYGFVSAVLPSTDEVFWQFSASRMQMAIVAAVQTTAQAYVFGQLDGSNSLGASLATAVGNDLQAFFTQGALYGATPTDAYMVDAGSDVNTTQAIASGQLNVAVAVRLSAFAQMVRIVVNTLPVTQPV